MTPEKAKEVAEREMKKVIASGVVPDTKINRMFLVLGMFKSLMEVSDAGIPDDVNITQAEQATQIVIAETRKEFCNEPSQN